jgi:hypothetical protein
MPLYSLKCPDCGNKDEAFIKLKDFGCNLPPCGECGTMMVRVISPVNVMPDIKPYKSMVTGEMIGSRSHHRAHLKQHGCIEVGNEDTIPKPPTQMQKQREKEKNIKYLHDIYEQKLQYGERLDIPNRSLKENDTVML